MMVYEQITFFYKKSKFSIFFWIEKSIFDKKISLSGLKNKENIEKNIISLYFGMDLATQTYHKLAI